MSVVLVDGHVHFHGCYRLSEVLEAACAHRQTAGADGPMCLMLAHIGTGDPLQQIQEASLEASWSDEWSVRSAADSLVFEKVDQRPIIFIAGRQLATRERLEVLAIGTSQDLKNGLRLEETVEAILHVGAVPVIPWAFGKWWFGRGRLLDEYLQTRGTFLLGDNGCRPDILGPPKMFQKARERNIPFLAGSDPLPWASHEARVGSYGSIVSGAIDLSKPASWIRQRLFSLQESPTTFGACQSAVAFCRDQIHGRMTGSP